MSSQKKYNRYEHKNNNNNLAHTLVGSGTLKPVLITDTIPMFQAVCRACDCASRHHFLIASGTIKLVLITATIPMFRAVCRAVDIVSCNLRNEGGKPHSTEHVNMPFSPIAALWYAVILT